MYRRIPRITAVAGFVVLLSAAARGYARAAEETQPRGNSSLTLTIRSDNEIYERGDDITIELMFKNNSGVGQILKFDAGHRLCAFFSFEISRDDKPIKAYRYIDTKDMQFPIEEKSLVSGEAYSMRMVINRLDWNLQDWPHGSPFDRKGHYDIRVIYFGISVNPQDNVISNTISIEVKGKNIFGWRRGGFESLAEASDQQVFYADMVEAYEQKRYTDARESARRHLKDTDALMEAAKNDFDLEAAVRLALGVIHSALDAEAALPREDVSLRNAEFLSFLKKELDRIRAVPERLKDTSAPVRAYIEQEIKACDLLWHRLGKGDAAKEQAKSAPPLTLIIQADKQVYEVEEKINITFTVSNIDSKPVFICNSVLPYYTDFDIRDSNQKSIEYICIKPSIPFPQKKDFIALQSNDSYEVTVDIAQCWNMGGTGIYTITAKHDFNNFYQEDKKILKLDDVWEGTLSSNTVTIEVKEKGR